MTPIVRDADQKSITSISDELNGEKDWNHRHHQFTLETVSFSFVVMKVRDLAKDDGVILGCEAIGNKNKELENGIESIIKRGKEGGANILAGNPIFTIAGSNRFGVYGVEFGWGQPTKVEMVINNEVLYMEKNGDESRSVEIGVVLPKHEMEEFITIFTNGLTFLSEM